MNARHVAEPADTRAYGDPPLPGIARADAELAAKLAAARKAKGPDYEPRTHYFIGDGSPKYTNRLILETSPYLLQHAQNPVNWYAWGDEAFERARREGKPVLLSVGYSTCHWCHVMERESFEDEDIARFMNEHFVSIKVDREERPDVDEVYMTAVQALTGRGGWPMTVALTPDRKPFFGGTYFPPRDGVRGARKGFLTILRELSGAYRNDPQRVLAQAEALSRAIQQAAQSTRPAEIPGGEAAYLAASRLARAFDPVWGGFGGAPKFPRPVTYEMLYATIAARRIRRRCESSSRSKKWQPAACTTTWAAGFTATRPTGAGSCRTSRRCSTTTRSSPRSTSMPTRSPAARTSQASRARRSITSRAR